MSKADYDAYLNSRVLRGLPPRKWGYTKKGFDASALPKDETEYDAFFWANQSPVVVYSEQVSDFDSEGRRVVVPDKVREAAREFVKDTQYAKEEWEIQEWISSYQTSGALNSRARSEDGAIKKLNREKAAQAQAILTAAEVGKVKLTDPQRQRLERAASGEYYQMVEEASFETRKRERREKAESYRGWTATDRRRNEENLIYLKQNANREKYARLDQASKWREIEANYGGDVWQVGMAGDR